MSIKRKLYVTFGAIIALLIGITIYSSIQMSKMVDSYTYLIDDRAYKVVHAATVENATSLQGLYLRSYILQQKQVDLDEVFKQVDVATNTLAEIEPMFKTEKMIAEINTYKDNAALYTNIIEQVETAVKAGQLDQATSLVFNEAVPVNREMRSAINNIITFQTEQMDIASNDSKATAAMSKRLLMIAAVIITLAAMIIGVMITLSITRPLARLTTAANTIATGDLRVEDVHVQTKDEVAHLADAFNKMKHNLKSVLESVSANVTNTTAATEQLAASTDEITIATKEIAERMEEIAADSIGAAKMGTDCAIATDESAHGVHRIAEAAQHLQDHAMAMQNLATTGEQTIETTEQQMNVIQHASNTTKQKIQQLSVQSAEIENISKVITAITEQTNLLALNAAIEAARAGEYGKGFAVVADEVRKLAEESKHSATKIGELTTLIQQDTKEVELSVNDTVNNVDKGVLYLQQAQSSFTTITESISSMTAQIQEVSAAAEEVSASTGQVSTSVQTMAQTVDTSATKSEVILAAAEEQTATMSEINSVAKALNDGAVALHEEISQFKL